VQVQTGDLVQVAHLVLERAAEEAAEVLESSLLADLEEQGLQRAALEVLVEVRLPMVVVALGAEQVALEQVMQAGLELRELLGG
jgi:hypothetical protein